MVLHGHLRVHSLELVVFRFQVTQPRDVGGLHAAVLRLPRVVRRFGDT